MTILFFFDLFIFVYFEFGVQCVSPSVRCLEGVMRHLLLVCKKVLGLVPPCPFALLIGGFDIDCDLHQ